MNRSGLAGDSRACHPEESRARGTTKDLGIYSNLRLWECFGEFTLSQQSEILRFALHRPARGFAQNDSEALSMTCLS
jgi:hypothetical protein